MPVVPEVATLSDVPELQRLRDSTATWLLGRGIEQWSIGEVPPAAFMTQVVDGEWQVVRRGTRVLACLRLVWADTAVWGETAPVAGYVHGLTTDRQHGRGLGRELLDWAGTQVVPRNRSRLRLDCQERNQALRAYYRRLGFDEVGRTDFGPDPRWHPVVRFERREAWAAATGAPYVATGRTPGTSI